MDNVIKLLEPNVANKIAAGEVIDRPVSIIKELLENSIDANADSIVVEIKNGGKSYIRVTDNGIGIGKAYIKTAFLRHATGKIRDISDLDSIKTLGFRGEALASIVAVSRTTLTSRTRDEDIGNMVTYHGSTLIEEGATGCPVGTTVIVKDLFYNTPARMKFLKADNTESSLIIDLVSKIAMAYPEIKMRLINNGKILFSTTGKGDIFNNIVSIFDSSQGSQLIKVDGLSENISMTGYVSKPSESRKNRKHQVFFVNGRVISSKIIEESLEKAYEEKIFEGRYPTAYLFFNINPEMLDVNIHPNKKEIRFGMPEELKELITKSVFEAVNNVNAMPEINISKSSSSMHANNVENIRYEETPYKYSNLDFVREEADRSAQAEIDINYILSTKRQEESNSISQTPVVYDDERKLQEKNTFKMSSLKIIGTLFNTYILCQDSSNFYMIDQHAAHERVFYEEFLNVYNNENREIQTLLHPFVVNVSLSAKLKENEWFSTVSRCGFILEDFGEKAYLVKGIPLFMSYGEGKSFLEDMLSSIDYGIESKNMIKIDKLISRSCKSAVKAHDILSESEIKSLLESLEKCEKPYSCPHGRPTFIKMSEYEIEKMFKRIV